MRGRGGLVPGLVLLVAASWGCEVPRPAGWTVDAPSEEAARAVQEGLGPFAPPRERGDRGPVNLTGMGYDLGSPTARVTVVEFSDFGCGYCRQFHEVTFPTLRSEYVDTGRVRWKYVPFTIGMFPNASEAALAGDCAGEQGRFHEMKARLYAEQSTWRGSRTPFELFGSWARDLGLDEGRFSACLLDERRHQRLEAANAAAGRLGVRGTPTFFVQGFPVQGAIPLTLFRSVLDEVLQETSGDGDTR